jgi:hypothetical protein
MGTCINWFAVFMRGIVNGRVGQIPSNPKSCSGGENGLDLTNRVIQCEFPADVKDEFLRAIDLALSGEWDAAHKIVQQYEDETACWIHAVLHKIEGDQDNSRYWYRRARKLERVADEPKEELAEIRREIVARV